MKTLAEKLYDTAKEFKASNEIITYDLLVKELELAASNGAYLFCTHKYLYSDIADDIVRKLKASGITCNKITADNSYWVLTWHAPRWHPK